MPSLGRDDGMKRPDEGYVLLEVMVALVVLLCGTLVVADSFRSTLRMDRQCQEMYQAALLLEARILEIEKTGQADISPVDEPGLGAVTWNQDVHETDVPGYRQWRLQMIWGQERKANQLELTTLTTN